MYRFREYSSDDYVRTISWAPSQVTRFSKHKSILGWYIADEPDGAGTTEGPPIGVDPEVVAKAYRTVKSLDPLRRPVLVSLNCMHSAPYYQHVADVILVDPYPISIDTQGCTTTYGCCGCDDCDGFVSDVARRLDHVGSILQRSKPIWLVVQAFGGEGHWTRKPTPPELRAMTYLGLQHGEWLILYYTNLLVTEHHALARDDRIFTAWGSGGGQEGI
eukprot:3195956-Pyramimonas_sp.AAC.2